MFRSKKSLLFLCVLFLSIYAFAQQNSEKLDDRVYETYDKIVSLDNTGLYNGTEFRDLYLNTDGTYRYFKKYDFINGAIVYDGQYYSNVPLKYDLLDDEIITRSNDNLSVFLIKLIPEKVSEFTIYNTKFKRLVNTDLDLKGNNYFEEAYFGKNYSLYIKNSLTKKERALKSGIQYRFGENNYFLLFYKGKYQIINSLKDLRRALPENEELIREFKKTYSSLYKLDREKFMVNLIKYLDDISEK